MSVFFLVKGKDHEKNLSEP